MGHPRGAEEGSYHGAGRQHGTREWDGHREWQRIPFDAKVQVPHPFTGEPGKGPTLDGYLADVGAEAYKWEENGLCMRAFFGLRPPTLEGEAKMFYIRQRKAVLAEPERDAEGRVCRDEEGRPILLKDPCHFWARMLYRRFRGPTADKVKEYQHFERRQDESALSLHDRLSGLADDLDVTNERELVLKYLDAVKGGAGDLLRNHVIVEMGEHATLQAVADRFDEIEQAAQLFMGEEQRHPARDWVCEQEQGGGRRTGRGETVEAWAAGGDLESRSRMCWACADETHSFQHCPHRSTRHQGCCGAPRAGAWAMWPRCAGSCTQGFNPNGRKASAPPLGGGGAHQCGGASGHTGLRRGKWERNGAGRRTPQQAGRRIGDSSSVRHEGRATSVGAKGGVGLYAAQACPRHGRKEGPMGGQRKVGSQPREEGSSQDLEGAAGRAGKATTRLPGRQRALGQGAAGRGVETQTGKLATEQQQEEQSDAIPKAKSNEGEDKATGGWEEACNQQEEVEGLASHREPDGAGAPSILEKGWRWQASW